jgi:hypothetical protein
MAFAKDRKHSSTFKRFMSLPMMQPKYRVKCCIRNNAHITSRRWLVTRIWSTNQDMYVVMNILKAGVCSGTSRNPNVVAERSKFRDWAKNVSYLVTDCLKLRANSSVDKCLLGCCVGTGILWITIRGSPRVVLCCLQLLSRMRNLESIYWSIRKVSWTEIIDIEVVLQ